MAAPWRTDASGLVLLVKVTPRAKSDAVGGIAPQADGSAALKVSVRAAPSDGEANLAVMATLARALGMPARRLTLVSGQSARLKRIRIDLPLEDVIAALERLSAPSAP
jgi:hypothetical protein